MPAERERTIEPVGGVDRRSGVIARGSGSILRSRSSVHGCPTDCVWRIDDAVRSDRVLEHDGEKRRAASVPGSPARRFTTGSATRSARLGPTDRRFNSLQRFAYTSPSDLNTATPTSEATFNAGNPTQLFVNQANGDMWGAFASSTDIFGNHVTGALDLYPAAYNLANGSTASKSFQLTTGGTDAPFGVAYSPAAGGTLYASWTSSSTTATYYVTGIDSAPSGLVSATGTLTSASGTLAVGNSMLLVPSGTSVQAWSTPTPGNSPIKTVSMPSLGGTQLFYVP